MKVRRFFFAGPPDEAGKIERKTERKTERKKEIQKEREAARNGANTGETGRQRGRGNNQATLPQFPACRTSAARPCTHRPHAIA